MPNMLARVLKRHTLDMGSLGSMCGVERACAYPIPTGARPHPHRGSDVGLGLPKLLPQSLCQCSDGILGSTIEMDHRLG